METPLRYLAALLLLVISCASYAQPACTAAISAGDPVPSDQTRLQWNKALFSDGSAITGESYVVASRAGSTGAFTDRCLTSSLAVQMLAQPTGRNEYVVRTRLTGYTDSGNAGPVFKVNAPVRTLNPPTGLVVSPDNLVAYGIQQSETGDGTLTTFPVGVLTVNTPCNGATSVNGMYQVPRSAVTWAGDVRPPVVVALCLPSGG